VIANPWIAIATAMAAFLGLFAALTLYKKLARPHPEATRKLLHAGSGLLTLSFPFVFNERWPVLLLTGATAILIATIKFSPWWHRRLGNVVDGMARTTLGEIYFPVAVAVVFWMSFGQTPLLFVIPILVLTLADATGAVIGLRYGLSHYVGASKTVEGSAAFVVVAFFCIHVPLLLWSDVGRVESLLISATLALVVMLLEGSAWRGLDNLFIPIGGFFLLRAYLPLDVPALAVRFVVVVALVILVILSRRSTTLADDSLVAGVFLCYVTWALMGFRWLVPPLLVFVGYSLMSPSTPENSRRMHDVPVILSVWVAAIAWLAIARAAGDARLIFPFTLVFATHLAIFGTSRLAADFPNRAVPILVGRALFISWIVVLLPFVLLEGVAGRTLLLSIGGVAAMAIGVVLFVRTQPSIRSAPQDRRRWALQAASAAVASMAGWLIAMAIQAAGIA
jgi:phytol kinase